MSLIKIHGKTKKFANSFVKTNKKERNLIKTHKERKKDKLIINDTKQKYEQLRMRTKMMQFLNALKSLMQYNHTIKKLNVVYKHYKLTETGIKNITFEIQTKTGKIQLRTIYTVEIEQKEANFLLSKKYNIYIYISHVYSNWKILKNPIVRRPVVAGYKWPWVLTKASIFVGHYL